MQNEQRKKQRFRALYFFQVGLNMALLSIGLLVWWFHSNRWGLFAAACGAVGLISTMMGGKKWGRIPFFFVVLPAALVTLISYQMQSPIWFPVFLTSLVAYRGKPLELRPTVDRRARFRGYGEESCDIGVTEWTERYFGEITHPDAARRPCHDGVHGVA